LAKKSYDLLNGAHLMFKKILLSIAMVFISFLTGYATAQSYFLNTAPKGKTPEEQSVGVPVSDFQSQTQEIEEKKKQALSNQLKQELAKVPPTPAPSTPPAQPGATPSDTPGQADAAPEANQAAQGATPTGPMPAAPPATGSDQSQVYTGFQNKEQNQNAAPSGTNSNAPSSSGGWNIKY
jgi:cytoskeletal protein RodZ